MVDLLPSGSEFRLRNLPRKLFPWPTQVWVPSRGSNIFSGFFFFPHSHRKNISIVKFLERAILTKMEKVKLNQYKVMFKMTCAEISFWNFQPMKISLDWHFVFIFCRKNCFYIHIFMGGENCFPCSCVLQVDSCIFHGYEHSSWGCHSSSLSWAHAGLWKWPELPWNCPGERRVPGQQMLQGHAAMQTICSALTPKELCIANCGDFLHVTRQN